MKIIIAAEIFPPDIGGPATYSQKLTKELLKRGFEIKLICYSDKKYSDDPGYIYRIVRRRLKPIHYFNYYRKLKKLARDCDVIYAMGPVSSGKPALQVAKELNKKLVVKVVGDYAWERARNSGKTDLLIDDFQKKNFSGKIGVLQKIERQVCQSADKVITPSQYLKKIVMGWGVDENKVEVIYNSFNKDFPSGSMIQPTGKFKFIISVGRLVSWKGFSLLIKLIPDLKKIDPSFKLIILGSGPQEEKLLEEARSLNLLSSEDVVIMKSDWLGVISYLRQAYIFVLNTGYEGLSHTILEAMATGVPVVTTNVGGNPELIKDGENGLLVEYNNKEQLKEAILKLYQNEDLRKKFIENSKKVLEKFSFANMINQTINLFNQLSK